MDVVVDIESFPPGFDIELSRSKPIVVKVSPKLQKHGISDGDSIISIGGNSQRGQSALETYKFIESSQPPIRIKFRVENFQTVFATWDRFLHIMGAITEIDDPTIALSGLGGFCDCLDSILNAINTSRHNEKSRKVKKKAAAASGHFAAMDDKPIARLPPRCEMPEAETLLNIFGGDLFLVMTQ